MACSWIFFPAELNHTVFNFLVTVIREWDDYDNSISLKLTCKDGRFHQIGYYDECDGMDNCQETTYRFSHEQWSEENRAECKVIYRALPAEEQTVCTCNIQDLKERYMHMFEDREAPDRFYRLFHHTWIKLLSLDWSQIIRVEVVNFMTAERPVRYHKFRYDIYWPH